MATYIAFENSRITKEDLTNLLKKDGDAKSSMIISAYILAKSRNCEPEAFGFNEGVIYADIDSISSMMNIKRNTFYKRMTRAKDSFTVKLVRKDKFMFFSIDANNFQERSTSKIGDLISARHSFNHKYRRTPPLEVAPDVNLMINVPIGDMSELCVPSNEFVTQKNFVTQIRSDDGKLSHPVVIIATGGAGISDANTMRTLYALISNTVHYHSVHKENAAKMVSYHDNVTPIYAKTVLEMIGRNGVNKESREYLWNHIARLRTTEYDIHSIKEHMSHEDQSLFLNNQFRFIESSPSMSEEAINPVTGLASPTFYEIKWHPVVFKSIIESKFFFAFPDAVFKEHVTIFSLYLFLRKRMRKLAGKVISISREELKEIVFESLTSDYEFQRSFVAAISRLAPEAVKEQVKAVRNINKNEVIRVKRDLYGFEVTVIFTGKRSFSGIDVKVNIDNILKHCGVEKSKNKSVNSSPTLPNPIYRQTKVSTTYNQDHGKAQSFGSLASKCRHLMVETDGDIQKTAYTITVSMLKINKKMIILKGTKEQEIAKFVAEIKSHYPRDLSDFEMFLIKSRDRLENLTFYGRRIEDSVIGDIVMRLGYDDTVDNFNQVYEIVAKNRKIRADLSKNKSNISNVIIECIELMMP